MPDYNKRAVIHDQILTLVAWWVAGGVTHGDPIFTNERNMKDYADTITFVYFFLEFGRGTESFTEHYTKFKNRDREYLEATIAWYKDRMYIPDNEANWVREKFDKLNLPDFDQEELIDLEETYERMSNL